MPAPSTWPTFLLLFNGCFTAPSRLLFEQLVTAWALCPGRRTLTRLWSVIPLGGRHPYGAYTRWVREGRWSMDELWRRLLRVFVDRLAPNGELTFLLDDTLAKKTGRKIEGAGIFRDPVLSTATYTVAAWGSTSSSWPCASSLPGLVSRWPFPSSCVFIARTRPS